MDSMAHQTRELRWEVSYQMINVTIEVEVNGVTLRIEREAYEHAVTGGNAGLDAEKAQALLLDAYHKINKGIESQK
jgi:hypothetical protein